MTKAAGILFISLNGNALFLRRTATAQDMPGTWDFPGGGQEGEETAEQTAVRETREEIGFLPDGERKFHTRTKSGSALAKGAVGLGAPLVGIPVDGGAPLVPSPTPDVDFTTFVQKVTNEFTPELNDEHDGWSWAPLDAPPEPLHPGCRIALERITMDELGVARAIADGRLISPQRYENLTLWAIRITGTGASFRPKHNEFVYRNAADHLSPDALARVNGLPVIFKHPTKSPLLNSEEFSNRVVGTIFLPYVAGNELWGIAKIFDDDVNQLLSEEDLSTSPGVNFENYKVNRSLRMEDGSKVLIEGKPSLFDHVAICERGVWDKGGEPTGIRSESREDSAMTPEEEKAAAEKAKKDADEKAEAEAKSKKDAEDKAKADADAGMALDKTLKNMLDAVTACTDAVTGMGKRMDAFEEKAKKDAVAEQPNPEKVAADKAKKDADDKEAEEKKAKEDKAKKDAEEKAKTDSADIGQRIAAVEAAVKDTASKVTAISDDDHHMLADAWSRADDIFPALGSSTPRAMPGETSMQYRRRVVKALRPHSPTWKDVNDVVLNTSFADDASFSIVERQVLAEAAKASRNPATVTPGMLRMIEKKRDGHIIRDFVGEPRTWMDELAGATQLRGTGSFLHQNLGRDN